MKQESIENRRKINQIKNALDMGLITYEEAKEMAKPTVDSINEKAVEIAKKYGVKPQLVSFSMLMR